MRIANQINKIIRNPQVAEDSPRASVQLEATEGRDKREGAVSNIRGQVEVARGEEGDPESQGIFHFEPLLFDKEEGAGRELLDVQEQGEEAIVSSEGGLKAVEVSRGEVHEVARVQRLISIIIFQYGGWDNAPQMSYGFRIIRLESSSPLRRNPLWMWISWNSSFGSCLLLSSSMVFRSSMTRAYLWLAAQGSPREGMWIDSK